MPEVELYTVQCSDVLYAMVCLLSAYCTQASWVHRGTLHVRKSSAFSHSLPYASCTRVHATLVHLYSLAGFNKIHLLPLSFDRS